MLHKQLAHFLSTQRLFEMLLDYVCLIIRFLSEVNEY